MTRAARAVALAAALLAAACGTQAGDDQAAVRQLRAHVEDAFPAVEVITVRGTSEGPRVRVDFVGPVGSAPEVHRLTRDVAHLVWMRAPRRTAELRVDQIVPLVEDGCGRDLRGPTGERCLRDSLVISFDDAVALWGTPPGPAPAGSGTTQPCTDLGGAALGSATVLDRVATAGAPAFGVRPARAVAIPRLLADRAAEHLWRCQPQPLRRLVVVVRGEPDTTFRYSEAELRQRFGPRPEDLEVGGRSGHR